MDTVAQIASKVAEFVDPRQEISYAFNPESYVENLKSQVANLKTKRRRVEQAIRDAETQGDEIHDDVKEWVSQMDVIFERADLIGEDLHNAKNKRSFGMFLFPSLMARRKVSKEAVEAAQVATELLEKEISAVSYRPGREKTEFEDGVRDYQQFDSRMKVFQDLLDELKKESKFNMIGVHGMGGVGKTTLVKRVAKKVMEDKFFDEMVMTEVTQTPDLETIRNKIAHDLGLKFDQTESVFDRADRIRRRLKKQKRVLVILDNIWGKLDLEAVGIPSEVEDRRQCTILLTSRSQHVLCNDMNSQKNFWIEVLSDAEAMSLFWNSVGDQSTKSSDFQSLAVDIVGKGGGLPLAIKTIANALKKKPLSVWKDALYQLRNSNPSQIPGMDKEVYSSINFSYDNLHREAKSLFQLCALQREGSRIFINNLMMYGMGLDLFTGVYTLEQARIRVYALIHNLTTSCLLMDGDTEGDVKMHDIIHAVAVSVARDELMHNIRVVAELNKEPEYGIQKNATAISLLYRNVQELPERLECPKLKLLLFAEFYSSLEIPDHFFEGMEQLRVLDIRGIGFFSLSSSVDCLINLRTLSLINCSSLGDVAIVGDLKKLEILSFRGSAIKQLPGEIGRLTRLKLLDLRDCRKLEVIAPNVISNLSQLEELYVGDSFTQWGKGKGGSNASIVELKALSKLTILDIQIQNVQIMPQDLVSVELEGFKILIGDVRDQTYWLCPRDNKYQTSKTFKFSGLDKSVYLGNEMKNLLRNIEYLHVNELNVKELDDRDGFPLLKHLGIENSSEILYVINSMGLPGNALSMLESLFLCNLVNLKSICRGQLIEFQSFSKLRIISVKECHNLKHLFSFSMAQNCVRLEELKVADCKNLNFIVGEERESHIVCDGRSIESVGFPKLYHLQLCDLPKLTRFVSMSFSISEENSIIHSEADTQTFFDGKVGLPSLKQLEIGRVDNLRKICHHQLDLDSFKKLKDLSVNGCRKLMNIFPVNIIEGRRFDGLETLRVHDCNSIEEIVVEEETSNSNSNCSRQFHVSPRLTRVSLCKLLELKSIYQKIHILEWPALKYFEVESCNKVEILFDDHKVKLPNLTTLEVSSCNALRNLATFSAAESLLKLKRMEVTSCKKIENIIDMQVGEEVKENLVVFSQLKYLKLHYLLRLESFCLGNYTLEFPCLAQVRVWGCPSMKIFSQGVLRTPMLQGVEFKFAGSEVRWEGNLNSSIQKLFEEMVGFQVQSLSLSEIPKLKEIWHDQILPVSFFDNLYRLVVDDCSFISSAIPTNLLPFLKRLMSLEVRNCNSVEEVVHLGENADENNEPLFPELRSLDLIDLPKLERFCNFQGNIIEFPNLYCLLIENCPNMKIFISNSTQVEITANKEPQEMSLEEINILVDAQSLFDDKVAFPCLKNLKLSSLPQLLYLSKNFSVFKNLHTLKISKCDNLINLVTLSSTAGSLVNLKRMWISDCKMLEEIIKLQDGEEVKQDPIVFSELQYLVLDHLPILASFCSGSYTLEFLNLNKVIVRECPKMKIFSQGISSTPKLQRLRLQLNELEEEGHWQYWESKEEGCWEGDLNSTIKKLFEEMNVQSFIEENIS